MDACSPVATSRRAPFGLVGDPFERASPPQSRSSPGIDVGCADWPFSPDCSRLRAELDGSVKLWRLGEGGGRLRQQLRAIRSRYNAWPESGWRHLASAALTHTIRLWAWEAGRSARCLLDMPMLLVL